MIAQYRRAAGSLGHGSEFFLLLARIALGLLFIDHGLQKYHAKGGLTSFEGFLKFLKNIPAPALTSQVVPALEVGGGLLLLAGVLSRVFALMLAAEMAMTGFFVKMHDLHVGVVSATATGAELDIVYVVLFLAIVVMGPGRFSLDAVIGLESEALAPVADHSRERSMV